MGYKKKTNNKASKQKTTEKGRRWLWRHLEANDKAQGTRWTGLDEEDDDDFINLRSDIARGTCLSRYILGKYQSNHTHITYARWSEQEQAVCVHSDANESMNSSHHSHYTDQNYQITENFKNKNWHQKQRNAHSIQNICNQRRTWQTCARKTTLMDAITSGD